MRKNKTPVYNKQISEEVALELVKTNSFLIDFEKDYKSYFKWKSGIIAPTYCNCRYLSTSYDAYSKVVLHMDTIIKEKFSNIDSIVGIATSGIPWSSQLAPLSKVPMAFVRSKLKEYGVGKFVDCNPKPNSKVILIDDLCSSGKSLKKAKEALWDEYNIKVVGCITIVNWGFSEMWDLFKNDDMEIISLTSYEELLSISLSQSLITNEQYERLIEFYNNPFSYSWDD